MTRYCKATGSEFIATVIRVMSFRYKMLASFIMLLAWIILLWIPPESFEDKYYRIQSPGKLVKKLESNALADYSQLEQKLCVDLILVSSEGANNKQFWPFSYRIESRPKNSRHQCLDIERREAEVAVTQLLPESPLHDDSDERPWITLDNSICLQNLVRLVPGILTSTRALTRAASVVYRRRTTRACYGNEYISFGIGVQRILLLLGEQRNYYLIACSYSLGLWSRNACGVYSFVTGVCVLAPMAIVAAVLLWIEKSLVWILTCFWCQYLRRLDKLRCQPLAKYVLRTIRGNTFLFTVGKMSLNMQMRKTRKHINLPRPSVEFRTRNISFVPVAILMCFLVIVMVAGMAEGSDRRQAATDNQLNCISYNDGLFTLDCDLKLESSSSDSDLGMDDYITLEKNEIFDGSYHEIELNDEYSGLFKISGDENDGPSSLKDAPKVQNLYMSGTIGGDPWARESGSTAENGGFIIQSEQTYFIVDSCSVSGDIRGDRSGGICGSECSGNILIRNCSSSGDITGHSAGGIAGSHIGYNGNDGDNTKVIITECHSTGDIALTSAGGICGGRAGDNGHLLITRSYSKGEIRFQSSGGICGYMTGAENGHVEIEQCYSEGVISGSNSGGITGPSTGSSNGIVYITNSYSRGDITGELNAGGICGRWTGGTFGNAGQGTVIIRNVYASAQIDDSNAGGIIGSVSPGAKEINITMSVYNGTSGPLVGESENPDMLTVDRNSNDLNDVKDQVYCYDQRECWDSTTIWKPIANGFPILRPPPTPSPTPSPTRTPSSLPSSTVSTTKTQTRTAANTNSRTLSPTCSPSWTVTTSATTSISSTTKTRSITGTTVSASVSSTTSRTVTGTATGATTASCTSSPSSATSNSVTGTVSGTMSVTRTPSVTETEVSTPPGTTSRTSVMSGTRTATSTVNGTTASSNTPTSNKTETGLTSPSSTPPWSHSVTPSSTDTTGGTMTRTAEVSSLRVFIRPRHPPCL